MKKVTNHRQDAKKYMSHIPHTSCGKRFYIWGRNPVVYADTYEEAVAKVECSLKLAEEWLRDYHGN